MFQVFQKLEEKTRFLLWLQGVDQLVQEELLIFDYLLCLNKHIDFSLRPYPFLNKSINFDKFFERSNFKKLYKPEILTSSNVIEFHRSKLRQVDQHEYVIHFGTTLGLEASLLNKKSILLKPTRPSKLRNFVLQRQIALLTERSKETSSGFNVPGCLTAHVISNREIHSRFVPQSIEDFSRTLCQYATK